MGDPEGAGHREGVNLRTTDEHRIGTERKRDQDIAAAAYAAVEQDRGRCTNGGAYRGQAVETRRQAIERATTVVRDDNPGEARIDRAHRIVGM